MTVLEARGVAVEVEALMRLRGLAWHGQHRRPSGSASASASGRRGAGLELDAVRGWMMGDDARHLAASVTARSGTPHVRVFRESLDRTTVLVADFRPSMLFGTRGAFRSVAAAQALALAGWQAAARGDRVGLIVAGTVDMPGVRPSQGERAMPAVIGALAHAHALALQAPLAADAPLDEALRPVLPTLPRAACLVLASALEAPGPGLAALLERPDRSLRLLLVRDAFERQPPSGVYGFAGPDGVRRSARLGRRQPAVAPTLPKGLRISCRLEAGDGAEAMLSKLLADDAGRA